MIDQREKDLNFNRKGYPLGMITDGDDFDRPEGSCDILTNCDYDVEKGEVVTRNSTILSEILDGFNMPSGYQAMVGGTKLFSFNNPVDRQVALRFIKNDSGNVRVYTNTWFNPPASDTDPVGSQNDYENHISSKALGWNDEWIELTEQHLLDTFVKLTNRTFTVGGTVLSDISANAYRGWFIWNSTRWNDGTTDKIKNESFACIESYSNTGTVATFGIQTRLSPSAIALNFDDMDWSDGDILYLIRYPIVVHKAQNTTTGSINLTMNFSPVGKDWLVKTNISIKCLIGQDGGLWFGFVNKDVTKVPEPNASFINQNKYYGWWLTYETTPVPIKTDISTSFQYNARTDAKVGVNIIIDQVVHVGSKPNLMAITAIYDGYQPICLWKAFNVSLPADKHYDIFIQNYHHYDRRIVGIEAYGFFATAFTDDPTGFMKGLYRPYQNISGSNFFIYTPSYILTPNLTIKVETGSTARTNPDNNLGLETVIQYIPTEQIYTKSTIGVYSQGRMFVNNLDQPDEVRYSLWNREDIMAFQNKANIDAMDRDSNVAINLLGVNPFILKQNSYHIIGIEGKTEVDWRLLDSKGRIGSTNGSSIVRTPYGLMFANDDGIWLVTDIGEPTNILRGRRLQAYLALPDKSIIFANWYAQHSEVWFYVGNNLFWVCKISKEEKQLGWKEYQFSFEGDEWQLIDVIVDDESSFYLVTTEKLIRYLDDSETQTGKDANDIEIPFEWRENFNVLNASADKFHWIENNIRVVITQQLVLAEQLITAKLYDEQNNVIKERVFDLSSGNNIILRNGLSNSQRAIKTGLSGTLTGIQRLKIQEVNTRIKVVPRPIKAGYAKVAIA